MRIFFDGSIAGKKELGEKYKAIYAALEKTGGKLLESPVMQYEVKDVLKDDSKAAADHYEELLKLIKKADVCVFEVSFPSIGIGHEITVALQQSKPVIALQAKGTRVNRVLDGIRDDRFQLLEYTDSDVALVVADAVSYATEQQDTRFNFFISPQIGAYLDRVSKERRLPRAVYLRRLIEEDMDGNEEYNG